MNIFLCVMLTSCAKFSYLVEQGVGQLRIQWKGKKIEKVLKDPKVALEVKNKIKKIQEYKKYFYKYFEKDSTSIYSKVTFLDQKAVTHLVIASYYDKVEPLKTSFPFAGSFPYLGFFKEKSAIKYQKKLERKDYYTYKRPVYAYSTLGKLEDRILSSFFQYSEKELVELVFHELFHTIFFVKSNVDLNENLANYFGKEMAKEYLKLNEVSETREEKTLSYKNEKGEDFYPQMRFKLVELIRNYKSNLAKLNPKSKSESDQFLKNYLESSFYPEVKSFCRSFEVEDKKCYPLKLKWNHASFSAFMTYEKKGNFILELRQKFQIKTLTEYLAFLEKELLNFKKKKTKKSFEEYLEGL